MNPSIDRWFVEFRKKLDELRVELERRSSPPGVEQLDGMQVVVADNWGGFFEPAPVLEERVFDPAVTDSVSPPAMEQHDAAVIADNWGGLFEQVEHTPEERGRDLFTDFVFAGPASSVQICISDLEAKPEQLLGFCSVPEEHFIDPTAAITSSDSAPDNTSIDTSSTCSTPAPLVSDAVAVSIREKEPVEISPAEYQSQIQKHGEPPLRTPAPERFVSIALDAACDLPAAADLQELESLGIDEVQVHSVDKPLVVPLSGTAAKDAASVEFTVERGKRARDFLVGDPSAPRPPQQPPLCCPRFGRTRHAPPVRRPWHLPPRPPRPRRRLRAPLRPPQLHRQRRAPPRPPQFRGPWRVHPRPPRLRAPWRASPRPPRLRQPQRAPLRRWGRPPRPLVRGNRPRRRGYARPRTRAPRVRLRHHRLRLRRHVFLGETDPWLGVGHDAGLLASARLRPASLHFALRGSCAPRTRDPVAATTHLISAHGGGVSSDRVDYRAVLCCGPTVKLFQPASVGLYVDVATLTTVRPAPFPMPPPTAALATSNAGDGVSSTLHTMCSTLFLYQTARVLVSVASVTASAEMPRLQEVERLLSELLLLPTVPMKPESRNCAICREFVPPILPCSHLFHQLCISWIHCTKPEGVSMHFGVGQRLILWRPLECSLGAVGVPFQMLSVSLPQKSNGTGLVSYDSGLYPLPWSSFSMVESNSVTCYFGQLRKPPCHIIHILTGGYSGFILHLSGEEDTVACSPIISNVLLPFSLHLYSVRAAQPFLVDGNGNPGTCKCKGPSESPCADCQAQQIVASEAGWSTDGDTYNDDIYLCVTTCFVDACWKLQKRIAEIYLVHLIIDRRIGLLLGVDKWCLIMLPAYIHQGEFLTSNVHVIVAVTIAETGATLCISPEVVWLANWQCSRLLWKPPWELSALLEIMNVGLDNVGDNDADEYSEHAAEDAILAEPTVKNAAALPSLPKDNGRQLSKRSGCAVFPPGAGHGLLGDPWNVQPAVAGVEELQKLTSHEGNGGVHRQEHGPGGSPARHQDHDHCSGLRASRNLRREECQELPAMWAPAQHSWQMPSCTA